MNYEDLLLKDDFAGLVPWLLKADLSNNESRSDENGRPINECEDDIKLIQAEK